MIGGLFSPRRFGNAVGTHAAGSASRQVFGEHIAITTEGLEDRHGASTPLADVDALRNMLAFGTRASKRPRDTELAYRPAHGSVDNLPRH